MRNILFSRHKNEQMKTISGVRDLWRDLKFKRDIFNEPEKEQFGLDE